MNEVEVCQEKEREVVENRVFAAMGREEKNRARAWRDRERLRKERLSKARRQEEFESMMTASRQVEKQIEVGTSKQGATAGGVRGHDDRVQAAGGEADWDGWRRIIAIVVVWIGRAGLPLLRAKIVCDA